MLAADLVGYQDERWAGRFLDRVESVVGVDDADRGWALTGTVAQSLHKLMAYKDEYEVARLMLLPEGEAAAAKVGGERPRLRWLLHPPVLAAAGFDRKLRFRQWSRPVFSMLHRARRLRGTAFDPFGRAEMRRLERAMIPEFESAVEALVARRSFDRDAAYDEAVRIARLPDQVRGYEGLKLRRAAAYRAELASSLAAYRVSD
jgi:indolepyruvate ferredoxin oxidoreductase